MGEESDMASLSHNFDLGVITKLGVPPILPQKNAESTRMNSLRSLFVFFAILCGQPLSAKTR
jgi:hypothetical protein